MSDIDTEPETDWENEEYSELESDEETDNSEDRVVNSGMMAPVKVMAMRTALRQGVTM